MTPVDTVLGAAVRLFEPTDTLGLAEGIETAIAAHELFGVPTWAAISADGHARSFAAARASSGSSSSPTTTRTSPARRPRSSSPPSSRTSSTSQVRDPAERRDRLARRAERAEGGMTGPNGFIKLPRALVQSDTWQAFRRRPGDPYRPVGLAQRPEQRRHPLQHHAGDGGGPVQQKHRYQEAQELRGRRADRSNRARRVPHGKQAPKKVARPPGGSSLETGSKTPKARNCKAEGISRDTFENRSTGSLVTPSPLSMGSLVTPSAAEGIPGDTFARFPGDTLLKKDLVQGGRPGRARADRRVRPVQPAAVVEASGSTATRR